MGNSCDFHPGARIALVRVPGNRVCQNLGSQGRQLSSWIPQLVWQRSIGDTNLDLPITDETLLLTPCHCRSRRVSCPPLAGHEFRVALVYLKTTHSQGYAIRAFHMVTEFPNNKLSHAVSLCPMTPGLFFQPEDTPDTCASPGGTAEAASQEEAALSHLIFSVDTTSLGWCQQWCGSMGARNMSGKGPT